MYIQILSKLIYTIISAFGYSIFAKCNSFFAGSENNRIIQISSGIEVH